MKKNIIRLDTVDSTNNYLKELGKDGCHEGTAVIADKQTAGRGRMGRSFISPEGGLYMSVLLKPEHDNFDFLLITSAAAVAVCRAVEAMTDVSLKIKWVNDIYLDDKKLCGILTEGVFSGNNTPDFAVLGIGLNIIEPENGFDENIKNIATSLFKKEIPDNDFKLKLCGRILDEFFKYYENLSKREFLEEYRKRSFIINRDIYYISGDEKHFCRCVGIDDNCNLIVEENGVKKQLGTGEITVRTRKDNEG